ncbi:MAG: hypothetical protein ACYSTZ_10315, partial [Planctomycetota bacterium]
MHRELIAATVFEVFLLAVSPCYAGSRVPAKSSTLEHGVVFSESDKFAAWPANNGVWSWGDEILVGFTYGRYKVKDGHDIEKPQFNVLGRSTDGGRTWKIED